MNVTGAQMPTKQDDSHTLSTQSDMEKSLMIGTGSFLSRLKKALNRIIRKLFFRLAKTTSISMKLTIKNEGSKDWGITDEAEHLADWLMGYMASRWQTGVAHRIYQASRLEINWQTTLSTKDLPKTISRLQEMRFSEIPLKPSMSLMIQTFWVLPTVKVVYK